MGDVILQTHLDFIKKSFWQIQDDSDVFAVLPTLMFIIFTFLLTHSKIHRRSGPLTSLKVYLYRELLFQWTYFYLMKAWFIAVEINKLSTKLFRIYLKSYHEEAKLMWVNSSHIHSLSYMCLMFVSMVPFYFYLANCKRTVPNFMIWMGADDPWGRSEIGLSGHYLDNPPRFVASPQRRVAYRIKKSTSAEGFLKNNRNRPVRNCKSLIMPTKRTIVGFVY